MMRTNFIFSASLSLFTLAMKTSRSSDLDLAQISFAELTLAISGRNGAKVKTKDSSGSLHYEGVSSPLNIQHTQKLREMANARCPRLLIHLWQILDAAHASGSISNSRSLQKRAWCRLLSANYAHQEGDFDM